jgi:AraC-like DNA-binding protein
MRSRRPEIPVGRVNAGLVGREHILEAWREAISPICDTYPLCSPSEFDASIVAYNLDGLVVSRVRFDASYFERNSPKIRADKTDCITVQHYLSGSIRGQVGDHELHVAPDRISIQDSAVPYSGRAEASELLSVAISRHRVPRAERLRTRLPVCSLPLNTARGSLLARALAGLWTELCAGRVFEPDTVADAFLGLVNGLIEHSAYPAPDRSCQEMEQYLREHLSDATLGPEDLERKFNVSRSAIYRRFEPHGGVVAFIRSERLRRCHAELIRPRAALVPVSAIAGAFGFHDASQFSRLFRKTYGVAPSELAAAAGREFQVAASPGDDAIAEIKMIKSWLEAV